MLHLKSASFKIGIETVVPLSWEASLPKTIGRQGTWDAFPEGPAQNYSVRSLPDNLGAEGDSLVSSSLGSVGLEQSCRVVTKDSFLCCINEQKRVILNVCYGLLNKIPALCGRRSLYEHTLHRTECSVYFWKSSCLIFSADLRLSHHPCWIQWPA